MPNRVPRASEATRKPPPKQARSAAKRVAILDTTETLLNDHAPGNITTRLIAEAGGIPIGSIYRYFANVDDLLLALFRRMNAGTVEALKNNKVGEAHDWRRHLDLTFDHLRTMHNAHPAYGALMIHVDLGDRDEDEISQLLGELLHRSLPQLEPALVREITQTVIALLEGVERRLYRLPETQRSAALDQARIAVAAYLTHYLDTVS